MAYNYIVSMNEDLNESNAIFFAIYIPLKLLFFCFYREFKNLRVV